LQCAKRGTYGGYFKNSLGKQIPVYLTDVHHVPGLNVNLFSVTKCINKPGIEFKGTHKNLALLVQGVRIDFEKQLTYASGTLYASDITPSINKNETDYAVTEGVFAIIYFDKFHNMMGHPHMTVLKETERQIKFY
jgi:hypothetical protein